MPVNQLAAAHIPFALPRGPWIMRQTWQELLFLHWPVPAAQLAPLLPPGLTLDTVDGAAWVGVVPFTMRAVRPRGMPAVPWLSYFPELNVRTYVSAQGQAGVWFFSLDAGNPITVALARQTFHLPYFNASFVITHTPTGIDYAHQRTQRGATSGAFHATYRPLGAVYQAQPGSLEYFLTERYCLYTTNQQGQILRGVIRHPPWQLQAGAATIHENTLAAAGGITLPDRVPLAYYARQQRMVAWPLARIDR